jgi:hypothetical protein
MKVRKKAGTGKARVGGAHAKIVSARAVGILRLAGTIDYDPTYDYKAERRNPRRPRKRT